MSQTEVEAQLTLKDRLNFPYLLANQILTFQKSILNFEFSDREIREAIDGFVNMIPTAWKDKRFNKDLDDAMTKEENDIRPTWCGIPMSLEACEDQGITPFEEYEVKDYGQVFQACMNLLHRRKLLSRVQHVEVLEGVDFDTIAKTAVLKGHIPSK